MPGIFMRGYPPFQACGKSDNAYGAEQDFQNRRAKRDKNGSHEYRGIDLAHSAVAICAEHVESTGIGYRIEGRTCDSGNTADSLQAQAARLCDGLDYGQSDVHGGRVAGDDEAHEDGDDGGEPVCVHAPAGDDINKAGVCFGVLHNCGETAGGSHTVQGCESAEDRSGQPSSDVGIFAGLLAHAFLGGEPFPEHCNSEGDTDEQCQTHIPVEAAEQDEVYLYRYVENDGREPSLLNIESDEEYELVSEAFDEELDAMEYEDLYAQEDEENEEV